MRNPPTQSVLLASCGEFTRTRPLLDGRVRVEGYSLRFVPDPYPPTGLLEDYQARRNLLMSDQRAFAVCEMGLAPLVAALSRGLDLVAVPVFHYRRFRHSAIVCRSGARIARPEDLIGKRVGVRRLSLSAGIWARGLLQHEYGVPLERVSWVVQSQPHLRSEIKERLPVTVVEEKEPLDKLLLRGELDAMIEAFDIPPLRERSRQVHPLFQDPAAVELDYYRRTGIFPIRHTVVLWREHVERNPELPLHIHAAFLKARELGALEAERPTRYVLAEEEGEWRRRLPPEAWRYSLREDRKTVETFLDYAYEQGIAHRRFKIEDLFAPVTLEL